MPEFKKYVPLGEARGISITLWNTNLQLQRREKQNGNWVTTQEINLAIPVLKELLWIVPKAIETIEEIRQKVD